MTTSAITAFCVAASILFAEAQRALEPSKSVSRIGVADFKSKPFVARFASIQFSTILDRISSLMCVIFRIAKKSLSVRRE